MDTIITLLLDKYESYPNLNAVDYLSDTEFADLLTELHLSDAELAD